jgi:acetyltransferase-like isoleucine patch superfamily enzyme
LNSTCYKNSGIVNVEFGSNVVITQPVNLYGCKLGNEVKVGPFVEIQKGVLVGDHTKIQSHTFICEMVSIGSNCFIGHGVVFINDLFSDGNPAAGDRNKWLPTTIGDFVQIGSNATILPVNICSRVVIGAGSVVTKDIIEPGFYVGNPARKLRGLND